VGSSIDDDDRLDREWGQATPRQRQIKKSEKIEHLKKVWR